MAEQVIFVLAAIATIAEFLLEAWREWRARKSKRCSDGAGKEKDGSR